MNTRISYQDHLNDMEEFEPYLEFLEDQSEMETAVRYLMEFPNVEYLGEEFQQAYYKAVRDQLAWFKGNAIIKEIPAGEIVVKTRARKCMEYKE